MFPVIVDCSSTVSACAASWPAVFGVVVPRVIGLARRLVSLKSLGQQVCFQVQSNFPSQTPEATFRNQKCGGLWYPRMSPSPRVPDLNGEAAHAPVEGCTRQLLFWPVASWVLFLWCWDLLASSPLAGRGWASRVQLALTVGATAAGN